MLADESTPRDQFRAQLRVSGVLLLALVLSAAPTLFLPDYAKHALARGFFWPLEFEYAGGGHPVHLPIGLVLGLITTFGRVAFAGAAALLASLWGLFAVTIWFSPMGLLFAYFGGLGLSALATRYLPRSPRWVQGVALPALLLLVGSRAWFVGPSVLALVQAEIRSQRYERNKPPDPIIHCDDTLAWLCAPGLDLDGDQGGSIAVLSTDGSVSLWDRKGRKRWRRASSEPAAAAFPLLRFTPDGSHLLQVFGEAALLLDSATGETVAELEASRAGGLDSRAFAIVDREIVFRRAHLDLLRRQHGSHPVRARPPAAVLPRQSLLP